MLRKLAAVVALIGVIGATGISFVSDMESETNEAVQEFYSEDNGYNVTQKAWIVNQAFEKVKEDLNDLDFGGGN